MCEDRFSVHQKFQSCQSALVTSHRELKTFTEINVVLPPPVYYNFPVQVLTRHLHLFREPFSALRKTETLPYKEKHSILVCSEYSLITDLLTQHVQHLLSFNRASHFVSKLLQFAWDHLSSCI